MSNNETNANALFNALRAEAKQLGINTKGMKKPEIEQAIRDAQAKFEEENPDVAEDVPEVQVEEIPTTEPTMEITSETVHGVATAEIKRLGRPVDPNSPRQIRLAEQARLREEGKLKRGRPVVEGCPRQERMNARLEKIAQGIAIKPGRPKMVKPEVIIAENVVPIEEVHPITEEVEMPETFVAPVEVEIVPEQGND
jgi:hypothetical protein